MFSTDWKFPGTANSAKNLGANDWATPDNIKADDANNAQWIGSKFDGNSPHDGPELIATNFGFSVPTGTIITGVETKIEGRTDSNVIGELAYLTQLSSPITHMGTEKTDDWTDIPTSDPQGIHVYGSSADLWGTTLTPEIVNNADFGWIFMIYDDVAPLQAVINYMQMRIHYKIPDPIIIMVGA